MMTVVNHIAALRGFARHPSQSRDAVVEYQSRQLRRLVAHAYARVPYYRALFDAHGLSPRHIQSVDDLDRIPITPRRVLQERSADELVARGVDHRRLIVHNTSGSSGKPVNIRRTWLEERVHGALRLRALRSFGLRVTDRRCTLRNAVNTYGAQNQVPQRIVQDLKVFRQHVVDGFLPPDGVVDRLRALRPHVLSGYPLVLARIAQVAGGERLRSLDLRFVTSGGGVLTPLMRRQIEEGFAAPLYETYGAHEFNLIAWQCVATGELHCADDGMIMEVLQDGRPVAEGGRGEVVGTNLHAFAMPLIRYQFGDVVTRGHPSCACGRPFATIRAIQGRMIDYFHLPGGRVLHPHELLRGQQSTTPWLREYQVIQERVDKVVIRIVPTHPPTPQEIAALHAPIAAVLGTAVSVEILIVAALALEASGKFRLFRSHVHSAYDDVNVPGSPRA